MPLARPVIDSAAFARDGKCLKALVAIAELPRLQDQLADPAGRLDYAVRGAMGRNGELFLQLEAAGTLQLRCQRCLAALPFLAQVACRFRLVESGQPWPDEDLEDDSIDAIAAERELDVVALVEQEVLLVLPLAARHDACGLPGAAIESQDTSPFAGLAALKRGLH